MIASTRTGSEALAAELRNVVHEAEELLRAVGDGGDAALETLRSRVYGAIDAAKDRLGAMEEQARLATQRAAIATENYVEQRPWTVVSASLAVGLVLGALFTRNLSGGR
jgi:ElaB/YqjD/DUF883 family membrane-anchored ribosome-binding protein